MKIYNSRLDAVLDIINRIAPLLLFVLGWWLLKWAHENH